MPAAYPLDLSSHFDFLSAAKAAVRQNRTKPAVASRQARTERDDFAQGKSRAASLHHTGRTSSHANEATSPISALHVAQWHDPTVAYVKTRVLGRSGGTETLPWIDVCRSTGVAECIAETSTTCRHLASTASQNTEVNIWTFASDLVPRHHVFLSLFRNSAGADDESAFRAAYSS